MSVKHISSEDVAMVIEGILYGDDSGFESVLENGFNELEAFAEKMREANKTYTIATFDN
ncbi:hypothetical protein LHA31_02720 [Carnobacterium viridans]|uniref:Uncharacterized protein n=1 Tax=Carnobacterium viridans TaxID=174587 RepID=A0A1H1BT75_9LACT|nr:hypothetical protein [Carnobacterium viridans]UDE95708.1 hypothetical protein LHA31_02720 [Carnobacterium viridans]SDQ53683.1 hypothetical protein SAMN04487752_2673 [Carnobacterium viridans]SDQ55168.1 hypothetical protein SAMN04487752_2733 [Carnobacterium viridans]